jgi:hypothetical protein
MSYNLMVEGDLDLFDLSRLVSDYPSLEIFPIPADELSPTDAVGIAIASSRVNEATLDEVCALITQLQAKQLTVHDLMADLPVTSLSDLRKRILG